MMSLPSEPSDVTLRGDRDGLDGCEFAVNSFGLKYCLTCGMDVHDEDTAECDHCKNSPVMPPSLDHNPTLPQVVGYPPSSFNPAGERGVVVLDKSIPQSYRFEDEQKQKELSYGEACVFCRKRKIACSLPNAETPGTECM